MGELAAGGKGEEYKSDGERSGGSGGAPHERKRGWQGHGESESGRESASSRALLVVCKSKQSGVRRKREGKHKSVGLGSPKSNSGARKRTVKGMHYLSQCATAEQQ